ncbi:MAG: ROK family protein [Chloroflexota bacterium]
MTHYLAIDFGGTRTRTAWFDQSLTLIERAETLSQVSDSVETVIQRIIDTAHSVVPTGKKPDVIGISGPSPMDAEQGIILHAKTLPGWGSVPLGARISAAFDGVPTIMNNDANLAALAEYRFGAGRNCDPMIYLTISTGIGGGAIIGGKLFTGWRDLAIEPGHMRFTLPDGSLRRLEDLASGTALGHRATERLKVDNRPSLLREYETVDGKAVSQAATAGDILAQDLITETGHWLGLGLVNILHMFNPQAIVIGGGVSQLGDLLLQPVKQVIEDNILDPAFNDKDLIRLAELADDVCLYGAAYYCSLTLSH